MRSNVSNIAVPVVLLLFILTAAPITNAELFVHSVKGNPTLSMPGYFDNAPIEVGMYIHPLMKVQVSHSHGLSVHCGDPGKPITIINARQIPALCPQKKRPDTLRSDSGTNYPVIISPRKLTILSLDHIEWGYRNASEYQLIIRDFGGDAKTRVDDILRPGNGRSGYNITSYTLTKIQQSTLQRGQKYLIEIKDLKTGQSSKSDPGFSGVIQLASSADIKAIENNLKIINHNLDSDALQAYFSAIHLRNQTYYADSTRALDQTISFVNPIHRQHLQVKNAQSEGVPLNYLMKKWLDLLIAAVKKQHVATAALTCVEIRLAYRDLSTIWLEFLNNYKHRDSFKQYCDLTDL